LFVLDLKNYKILFNTLVAHGRNTGREWATSFSNQGESYKSSPGFYITRETYEGKNGYSLKLAGLERGINDNAYNRGIVIHGAEYVSNELANAQGYIGRSQGCPAVPPQVSKPIINTIKNGTCLFIYHPSYVSHSQVL
ncbi:MAG: murein L,D-transpeptidase catalytic domain family protein, partial [Chitinophagaceae bacterium]|nr:murein L,D-transpeptidase catalytic domain family protein [Chitinophagaceae bacterium]